MTVGDTILINYNNKRYMVDIMEAKPSDAVCIVDTDCEVDFAPPLAGTWAAHAPLHVIALLLIIVYRFSLTSFYCVPV
jgi:hypothetical protein